MVLENKKRPETQAWCFPCLFRHQFRESCASIYNLNALFISISQYHTFLIREERVAWLIWKKEQKLEIEENKIKTIWQLRYTIS
jgi:hypothetical protein